MRVLKLRALKGACDISSYCGIIYSDNGMLIYKLHILLCLSRVIYELANLFCYPLYFIIILVIIICNYEP